MRTIPPQNITPDITHSLPSILPAEHLSGTPISPVAIPSSLAQSTVLVLLIQFLQEELGVPSEAIALACRNESHLPNVLPMVLLKYGLVSLEQIDQIFDWLDRIQTLTHALE